MAPLTDIPISSFLPLVRIYAPSVPVPIATNAVRLAARELCTEAWIWRVRKTVTLVGGESVAVAEPNTSLVAVESALFGTTELAPIPITDVPVDRINLVENGPPRFITQINEGEITIYPYEEGDVELVAFLAPTAGPEFGVDGATTKQAAQNTLPRFLFENHAEGISHGALARLLMIPNEPYSQPQLASAFGNAFETYKSRCAAKRLTGQQRAPRRVKAHYM